MVSKTALLDVNMLIAILDKHHQFHQLATGWLYQWTQSGNYWVSCPITQNGCLRILSLPNYKNGTDLMSVKKELTNLTNTPHHTFIPDNISLLQDELINWQHIQGAKQLTDAYLLALAKYNGVVFVSLDNRIETNTAVDIGEQDFISLNI